MTISPIATLAERAVATVVTVGMEVMDLAADMEVAMAVMAVMVVMATVDGEDMVDGVMAAMILPSADVFSMEVVEAVVTMITQLTFHLTLHQFMLVQMHHQFT